MVRITKLTDYALVVLGYIAVSHEALVQAKEIAVHTHLSLTTVSKVLKNLTKSNFLHSERGATGGYRLNFNPSETSVFEVITALEGPVAITECNLGHNSCPTQGSCALRLPWFHINKAISDTLRAIKISDLIKQSPIKTHINRSHKSEEKFVGKFEKISGDFHGQYN